MTPSWSEHDVREGLAELVPPMPQPPDRFEQIRARVSRRRRARLALPALTAVGVAGVVAVVALGSPFGFGARGANTQGASGSVAPLSPCTGSDGQPEYSQNGQGLQRLDPAFSPVAVVTCSIQAKTMPDGSIVNERVERRGIDVTALTVALREPSRRPTGKICTSEQAYITWFALLDEQGRWQRPRVPTNECGDPLPAPILALQNAATTVTKTTFVSVVASKEAIASGCPQQTADALSSTPVGVGPIGLVAITTNPFPTGASMRVCIYQASGDVSAPQRDGELASGRPLNPALSQTAGDALAGTPRPQTSDCPRPATRFATIHEVGGRGPTVEVELDNCRRVLLDPDSATPATISQADPRLVTLLQQLGQPTP